MHNFKEKTLREKSKKNQHMSILDRVLNQEAYRISKKAVGWNEKTFKRMYNFAVEDHLYVATYAERERHENTWEINLRSGKTM